MPDAEKVPKHGLKLVPDHGAAVAVHREQVNS